MNGADAIWDALVQTSPTPLFANPGTTEIHLVEALARHPNIHPVLCLFEGVASGAADGYARISGQTGLALTHLGPGLANAIANFHNARRAHSPILAIVGEHPRSHLALDPPLASDIAALATTFSKTTETVVNRQDLGSALQRTMATLSLPPQGVGTLILPADIASAEGAAIPSIRPLSSSSFCPDSELLQQAVEWLREGSSTVLVVGSDALTRAGSNTAAALSTATGARVYAPTFPAVMERGKGVAVIERIAYLPEAALLQFEGSQRMILIGARAPVTFFSSPPTPSWIGPERVLELVPEGFETLTTLELLAAELKVATTSRSSNTSIVSSPRGLLTPELLAQALAQTIQEGAIIVDESNTSGLALAPATACAPPHRWLTLTGGAIGQGLPVALGASLAAPDSKLFCLESDGSALYTPQALHAMAREQTDVTVVILHNARYAILEFELARVTQANHSSLFDLAHPDLDFVALANGFGVPGCHVSTGEELSKALSRKDKGPFLIDAHLS